MEKLKQYKGYLVLAFGLLGLFLINYDNWFSGESQTVEEYSTSVLLTTNESAHETKVVVEIKGEVFYPGIYEVSESLRVGDIIGIAGGLTAQADCSGINQAQKVTDELLIEIPAISENTLSEDSITVEIRGAVLYPDIYEVEADLRVGELIDLAGGLSEEADITKLNLAEHLADESLIIIPAASADDDVVYAGELVRIVVEIKGAVKNPGVYTLYQNTRVYDLVELAGGLSTTADGSTIDMARILKDGESITIPFEVVEVVDEVREIYVEISGEVINPGVYLIPENYSIKDLIYDAGGVTVNCDLSRVKWDTVLVLGASIYIPSYSDIELEDENQSGLININNASLETLITLPGIGNILGQRIIDYRAEYGDFLSIEDVMNVSGIKESVYEQIKNLITV